MKLQMKNILFGIDGGGSKTKLLVTDSDLNKLGESSGGATNFHKIGYQEAVLNIENLVEPFLQNYEDSTIILVIGTAGAGRKNDALQFEKYLKESLTEIETIKVISDAEVTLKGAFENEEGAILIAGTGSILYFKIGDEVKRIGGYGRLLGDEGSGYSLGRKGLNIVSKMLDGRLEQSYLLELAKEKISINSPADLINKVNNENYDIASFAQVVISAALKSDKYSLVLIDEETDELLLHLKTMLDENKIKSINLVLSGGLLSNGNFYKNVLIDKINSLYPQIKITVPKYSPEYGAVLIAKELITENK